MYIFHIGLAKTGTTTLQRLMATNADVLAGRGILYPSLRGGRTPAPHHVLARSLNRGPEALPWATLRELHDRSGAGTVVVSAEGLSAVPPEMVREAIRGAEARVVAYVRPFPSWMVSSYSQRAKWGTTTLSFDAFLDEVGADRVTFLAGNLVRWADAFGPERVRLRSLVTSSLVGGNVVDDFLAALGTTRDGLTVPPDVNVSPDWRVVELVKERHERHAIETGLGLDDTAPRRRRLLKAAVAAGAVLGWAERAEYLTRDQRRALGDAYRDCSQRLAAAIPDCRIAEAEEPERDRPFLPCPKAVPADDRRAFEEALGAALGRRAQSPQDAMPEPVPGPGPRAATRAAARLRGLALGLRGLVR